MTNSQTYQGLIMIRGKGTGFFVVPDAPKDLSAPGSRQAGAEDILIERDNLSFALDGDIVEIELLPKKAGERQQAKVINILEATHEEIVGTVKPAEPGKPQTYLQPDNHRIHVRPQLPDATEADLGMKVVIKITSWKSPHVDPIGEIVETLGRAGDHETEMQAIIRAGGFSENFPEEIATAAEALYKQRDEIFAAAVEATKDANPTRRDMRSSTTMTIDPADAKDFDDALSIEQLQNLPASRPGQFYVYVILCDNDSMYIGQTNDLQRRWHEHKAGTAAEYTKKFKPKTVVHYEEFSSSEESVKREKELKTEFGRKWLKREYTAGRTRQAGGNFEVGIHIADVSHYVKPGDVIDREAKERGTSIYLVDRVIPMLPEVLSNDLCSLRPNEDRLAFSMVFEITPDGQIVAEWYGQTIIHSNKRFSYQEAQAVLDEQSGEYLRELNAMMGLGRIFRKRRYKNGAIAFEQPEVKFILDETGKPIAVEAKERIETMLMIEDFMLMANERVPTYIQKISKKANRDPAFIYRIHDTPDPDRIEELALFIHALGYDFKTKDGQVSSKDINNLLKQVEGKPEENLIKVSTIRSMAKAVYSTKNIGHYGLAFKFYTQFTSPIRRYPDLMAHRLLRRHLDGSSISSKEVAVNENTAKLASEREMYAVKAERDSIKYKQVEYMLDKVGQKFTGIITGVSDWGIYVAEKESMAEGMIRLAALKGDYYNHESSKYRVKGEKTGQTYSLGDELQVKLTRADLEERQLDFEPV